MIIAEANEKIKKHDGIRNSNESLKGFIPVVRTKLQHSCVWEIDEWINAHELITTAAFMGSNNINWVIKTDPNPASQNENSETKPTILLFITHLFPFHLENEVKKKQ